MKALYISLLVVFYSFQSPELSQRRLCGDYHWTEGDQDALKADLELSADSSFVYRMGNSVAVSASTGRWRYLGDMRLELICKDFSDTLLVTRTDSLQIMDNIYFKEGHVLRKS